MSNDKQPDDPAFNPVEASRQMANTSDKLLELLKAKQAAQNSSSAREFAVKSVRGLEPIILQLLEAGASTNEILTLIIGTLPAIPKADLRYALSILRGSQRRRLHVSSEPPARQQPAAQSVSTPKASKTAAEKKPSIQPAADLPAWADGSDRLPGESDDDYRLRKEIEGPPEARQKFIGEQ